MSQSNHKPRNGEHLRQIGRDPKMTDKEHWAFVERIRRYNMGLDPVSPYPPVKGPPPAAKAPSGDPDAAEGEAPE
jgi:hypothetical protein